MMNELEPVVEEKWLEVAPELKLRQLENLEKDGVNIQCINSSDFVVGRQVVFNGPVTIVNCAERNSSEEKIIIRDRVLSQIGTVKVQNVVEEKEQGSQKRVFSLRLSLILLFITLLFISAITLGVTLTQTPTEEIVRGCTQISNDTCMFPTKQDNKPTPEFQPNCIVISQTNGSFCYAQESCLKAVGSLEGCDFYLGSDGNVYEGNGWAEEDLKICFIGDYTDGEYPTYPQVIATKDLIQFAVEDNRVGKDYTLTVSKTLPAIYEIVKKWPKFVEEEFAILFNYRVDTMTHEHQLESQPEVEGDVNIQCIHSSEFVIGKQTNFSGPVTIINCPDHGIPKEKIVIRDKVLSHSVGERKCGFVTSETQKTKVNKLRCISVIVCVGLLVVVLSGLIVFLTTPSESTTNTNTTYHFYLKSDWSGKPPKSTIAMKLPVPYVVVSHTVTNRCFSLNICSSYLQNIQSYHFSREFADISYNFLLDSNGNIYEGRGWSTRNPRNGFVNGRNIDIGLMGDYSDDIHPTGEMMDGLKHLIMLGVEKEFISQNYSLIAANSTHATLSPGKNVYGIIKSWPHFDDNPKAHIIAYED